MVEIIQIPFSGQPRRTKPVCLLDHISRRHINQFAPYKSGDTIQVESVDGDPCCYIVEAVEARKNGAWWHWEITASPAAESTNKKSNMHERIP